MMISSVELYRSLKEEVGLERAGERWGGYASRYPRAHGRIARQAGWAKTFGLPLELI